MSHQFCSLGGRSSTSTLSSLVVLDNFRLAEDVFRIIDGRFDAYRLPELIHEFTHFSCLNQGVGGAISLLHLLSQRAAWEMNERKDNASAGYFTSLAIRYYAAVHALRPLSEGIAL